MNEAAERWSACSIATAAWPRTWRQPADRGVSWRSPGRWRRARPHRPNSETGSQEQPWTEARIAVEALPSVENEPHRPGEWRGITALAPADDLAAVSALPLGLAHEVAKNGDADIMKAFIVDRYEKKGSLRLGDMPEPTLRDDDVLVEIHAAGVNRLDSKIRDEEFKLILPYHLPFILGHDVAGT